MKIGLDEIARVVLGLVRGGCNGCTQRFSDINRSGLWAEVVKHVHRSGEISFCMRFRTGILNAEQLESLEHLLERHGVKSDPSTLEKMLVPPGIDNDATASTIGVLIQEMLSELLGLSSKDSIRYTVRGRMDVRQKTQGRLE